MECATKWRPSLVLRCAYETDHPGYLNTLALPISFILAEQIPGVLLQMVVPMMKI